MIIENSNIAGWAFDVAIKADDVKVFDGGQDQTISAFKWILTETHSDACYNMGLACEGLEQYRQAIGAWEQYLSLEPKGEHANIVRENIARLSQQGY